MGEVVSLFKREAEAPPGGERWLTKRQAAGHLSVTTRTIVRWQKEDGLPFRKVKGVNLYRRSELDAWVDQVHEDAQD